MAYNEDDDSDDEQVADAPVSPRLKVIRQHDLPEDEEEAITWSEVQRLVFEQMWGPILRLRPTQDDFFLHGNSEEGVDISAFNTQDFARKSGQSRRYGPAVSMAKQEHREAVWMFEMTLGSIKGEAKYRVLKYLKDGVIGVEHCVGPMRRLAIRFSRMQEAEAKIYRIMDAWSRAKRG